jgi:hypothetical protein
MSIAGSLRTTDVSELLEWARQGARTGALRFDNGKVSKRLYFDGGRIVAGASSVPQEQLGHFLVGRGLITELELSKAIELQEESGMLLGSILVSIRGVTEEQLQERLVEQCSEIIYDLLTWNDGSFEYNEGESHPRALIPARIDIAKLLLEGVKRLDDWSRLRKLIPTLRAVPVAVAPLEPPADDPIAAQVLALVDDRRSIEEIRLETHTTEFAVRVSLADALEAGRVKLVMPRTTGPVEPGEPARLRPVSTHDLVDCGLDAAAAGDCDTARRYLAAARALAAGEAEALERIAREERALDGGGAAGPALDLEAVPRPTRPLEQLTALDLSPQEGFLLTRMDGMTRLADLVKISPMPAADAERAIARLIAAGHVKLRAGHEP